MSSRKEVILQSAAQAFRKQGYKAASMQEIAQSVGIKAASIYNHFPSKQELLRNLLIDMAHRFTTGMDNIHHSSLGTAEKLEKVIELHIRLTVEHTDAIALITSEWVHLEEPTLSEYRHLRDDYEAKFRDIIETGKKEGLYQAIDTDLILFSILSTLRWLYSWYSKNPTYNQLNLEQQLSQCLIGGILQ